MAEFKAGDRVIKVKSGPNDKIVEGSRGTVSKVYALSMFGEVRDRMRILWDGSKWSNNYKLDDPRIDVEQDKDDWENEFELND